MKTLTFGMQALFFIFILSSCEGPKKSPDNQSVGSSTTQPAVDSNETSQPATQPNIDQAPVKDDAEVIATFSGTDIVEKALAGLIRKLSLTDAQGQKIKVILTESFLGMGQNLNSKFQEEKAKHFRKEIVNKAYEQISLVLDATQKEQFRKIQLQ